MSQQMNQPLAATPKALKLEYPMSVAVYDTYADAQKAVDFLADKEFPVENLAIVGTDLRQYERVLGRKSWGSVLVQGAVSGIGTGILIALMMFFLQMTFSLTAALLWGLFLGVVMGVIMAALAHLASRGQRDFNSITQTFARSYEVLAEHKVAAQARELLRQLPGAGVATAPLPEAMPQPEMPAQPGGPAQPGATAYPAPAPQEPTAPDAFQQTSSGWYPRPDAAPAQPQPPAAPQAAPESTTFDPRPPSQRG